MFRTLFLFTLLFTSLYSLEISFSSGKEDNKPYSLLKLSDKKKFFCSEMVDDFKNVTEIICAFKNRATNDFSRV